jgi:hypothetical protein
MELRLIPTPRLPRTTHNVAISPAQRERARRIRERFEIAMAPPGSVRLTPQQQAAKNLADLLMQKHPNMHDACDVLVAAIDRDQRLITSTDSAETTQTAEDRIELHRQAMDFIHAAHWRAGTVPKVPWDDDRRPRVFLVAGGQ